MFKKIIRKLHLWLGLGSGLVVFIVSVTGCIYVFEEEINLLLQAGVRKNVTVQNLPIISVDSIQSIIRSNFKGEILNMNATIYPEGDRAIISWVRDMDRKYTAFVLNPYDGTVINEYPYSVNFWAIVLGIHTSLLIPEIGAEIVAISTIIFVVMLITGLILWMPASKKGYKQRFTIKWGASPKRLNYDLHNGLGFYMSWIAIFVAITGLVMSYKWVESGISWIADTAFTNTSVIQSSDNGLSQGTFEATFQHLVSQNPDALEFYVVYPSEKSPNYHVTCKTKKGKGYNRHDNYEISPADGEVISSNPWVNKKSSEKISAANYNIHVGAILGLPGKILAFFASLVAASLPVTGFLVWRGRKKQLKKAMVRKRAKAV